MFGIVEILLFFLVWVVIFFLVFNNDVCNRVCLFGFLRKVDEFWCSVVLVGEEDEMLIILDVEVGLFVKMFFFWLFGLLE